MYGIDAYKSFQKAAPLAMTKLLVQFFTILLEQFEKMKRETEAENYIQRDVYFEKIQGWLMKFAQGFRDDNEDDQMWAEILTPLLVHVRDQARAVRRADFREYEAFCQMIKDLIQFWESATTPPTSQNPERSDNAQSSH